MRLLFTHPEEAVGATPDVHTPADEIQDVPSESSQIAQKRADVTAGGGW